MNLEKPMSSKEWRDTYYHRLFGLKAAGEAERVLKFFEREHPEDPRPRAAIDALYAWAVGERTLGMKEVRRLALDCHAAARESGSDAARFAARAAGQAIATWHVPTHALAAFAYAAKADCAFRAEGKTRKGRTRT